MKAIEEIISFWFGEGDPNAAESMRFPLWFQGGAELDLEIRTKFQELIEDAALGRLEEWKATPRGRLAWTILLDQFTRNAYRDSPRMYGFDTLALQSTREAIASGQHLELPLIQRGFLYLPLEHAEEQAAQQECVELYETLADDARGLPIEGGIAGMLDYAVRHERVVREFGRFPHRNEILSRRSTPEEIAFLKSDRAPF